MEFESARKGDKTLVIVRGRMDAVTAPEFEKEIDTRLQAGDTVVVADLTDLEYISSAGLRSILTSGKKLKAAGGSLAFCGLDGMVQEVFSVSGFTAMFPVFDTAEDAVEG